MPSKQKTTPDLRWRSIPTRPTRFAHLPRNCLIYQWIRHGVHVVGYLFGICVAYELVVYHAIYTLYFPPKWDLHRIGAVLLFLLIGFVCMSVGHIIMRIVEFWIRPDLKRRDVDLRFFFRATTHWWRERHTARA